MTFQTTAATALAYVTKLPVKVYQTRVEQMTNYQTRLGTQVHARMGIDKDGIIRASRATGKSSRAPSTITCRATSASAWARPSSSWASATTGT